MCIRDRIQGFFDGPVDHLWAMPLLAQYVRSRVAPDNLTIVSPDAGRVRLADQWSDHLGSPLAIIHKRRDPAVPNQIKVHELVGEVEGRTCVLVDDMIDTGGTIVQAANALFENGAKDVIVASTHGLLSGPPSNGCATLALPKWSSPTLCRFPTRSALTRSPCCRSRRSSLAPCARRSTTA